MNPLDSLAPTLTWHQVALCPKNNLASLLTKETIEELIEALDKQESIHQYKKAVPNIYNIYSRRNIPFRIVSRVIRKMQVIDENLMDRLSQAMTTARVRNSLLKSMQI